MYLAYAPSRPPKPVYTRSDDTSITFSVLPSQDNGGSTILQYRIERESGVAVALPTVPVTYSITYTKQEYTAHLNDPTG